MKSTSGEAEIGKGEKKAKYKLQGLKCRRRGLNPKPHLEIVQLLKIFEQCSNKKVVSERRIQQWYIQCTGEVTNWEQQYQNSF